MGKIKILSTKNLDQDLKNLFNKNKYELWEHDFIKIKTRDFTFPNHNESWIFFSKNSVKSIFSNKTAKNFSFKRIFFKGEFYLLEINTQPGMTKLSLVPEIAAHRGVSFLELIEWIMRDASKKK